MADRNMQYPQNQGFGMMQGMPQYVQPGSGMMQPQNRMMMAQAPMMRPGPPNMVHPGQMVAGQGMYPMMNAGHVRNPMMPPTGAPPSYNQARMDSYQFRNQTRPQSQPTRQGGKSEEQLQKERYYQQQQAKLKQFGKSAGSSLDPNKLIDSMFGGAEPPKPRSNKKQPVQEQEMNSDDGFGDFLSSPDSSGTQPTVPNSSGGDLQGTSLQMQQAVPTTVTVSVSKIVPTKPVAEKKDLTKMMFESCDLTAPQKAKLFHKPSLKDITVPFHETQVVSSTHSTNARKWDNAEELSNLFIEEAVKDVKSMPPPQAPQTKKAVSPTSKHPPKPPPWLTDDALIPPLYKQVVEASFVDGKIATDRVYPILLLSGLPKEKLGFIWGLCNKESPGQLVVKELNQILAIIALTQNNFQVESTDILSRCPNPPVPFLAQPTAGSQGPIGENQQPGQVTQPHMQMSTQSAPIGQSQVQQPGPQVVPASQVGVQAFPQSTGPVTSLYQGTPPMLQNNTIIGASTMTSSPATLPVTQLPPAVLPHGMTGNVVQSEMIEDDFADFQAAPAPASIALQPPPPGSFKVLMADVKESKRPPEKYTKDEDYLYSVPLPDDKAIAESLSPEDLKSSTVSNFFASDDSSEATSPDDDYFDGYKSAESKPSDSTSQFSTDQSENEDFKNFESYLDDFQKKKESLDKESPLHRPIPKFASLPKVESPIKSIPIIGHLKSGSTVKVSSDESSDFADFQCAPVTDGLDIQPDPLKASASASDLIGDEDKYAALRSLDFSETSPEKPEKDHLEKPDSESKPANETEEDNWADFAAAEFPEAPKEESSQINDGVCVDNNENKDKDSILKLFNKDKDESEWGNFDSPVTAAIDNVSSDWSAFSTDNTSTISPQNDVFGQTGSVLDPVTSKQGEAAEDEWADFQSTNNKDTVVTSAIPDTNKDLVTVKNDKLGSNEILSLFKVKEVTSQTIQSIDDDVFTSTKSSMSVSQSVNRLHGISPSHNEPAEEMKPKLIERKNKISDDDDFMKPPPLDSVNDDDFENVDEFGAYAGGYDLDYIMHPKVPEKKNIYGVYGSNQNLVLTGHKKESTKQTNMADDNDQAEMKNVTIEVTKESDMDDSDSVSSKDNDTFRGKFGLGKELGEDSQSVSSLDFIVNKQIHNLKDGDSQSVNSNDFGNFENGVVGSGSGMPVESKSVDSLELREDDGQGGETSGSPDQLDKDSKEESPDRVLSNAKTDQSTTESVQTTAGLPILGDRYSVLLSDVIGSDKHAYEWQRILDNACRMIQDANNIFNSITSSSVCNEVIKSTQGSQYIQGVVEIYRVACKIVTSMKNTGIHSDKLSKLSKDIDLAWNNLTAFLVGGSIMPDSKSFDYKHGILHPDDTTAHSKSCGVCLLNVEMKQRGLNNSDDNANLTYGGRQYHTACANFWINCVDSTLPALKLPELL